MLRCCFAIALCAAMGCAGVQTIAQEQLPALEAKTIARFFFPSAGGVAEGYLARPPGQGPFPLILFLHGHSWVGRGAEQLLNAARTIAAEQCFASLAISLPGYGATKANGGPLDQQTRQVVLDAIAAAKRLDWIDASRLYFYGHSRGAVVAAAMVNAVPGVEGAILRSGAYDLPYLYQETTSWWLKKLLNPKGEANPKLYNLLDDVPAWKTSTLILHGEQDSIIPPTQALRLRDRLQATGKSHRLVLYPERGHWLRLNETKEPTLAFLRERSGWSCATSDR
ncbi:MAG: hypothetical protein FJ145_12290 [Deltaproteobacteria bacterium]|nr:hypothetical protein [Deltaproteobacteria bacterium]